MLCSNKCNGRSNQAFRKLIGEMFKRTSGIACWKTTYEIGLFYLENRLISLFKADLVSSMQPKNVFIRTKSKMFEKITNKNKKFSIDITLLCM